MKKILAFTGLILWGGVGSALCEDVSQWKCPAQYTPQLIVNGQPFLLGYDPSFVLQKSTLTKVGNMFQCFYGASENPDLRLSFYAFLTDVSCSFDNETVTCNKNNCHCLGEDCVLTCTNAQN